MYSITIIRLNLTTKQFENTELHSVKSKPSINEILVKYGANDYQMGVFNHMINGDSNTIEIDSEATNKIWFIYITKSF